MKIDIDASYIKIGELNPGDTFFDSPSTDLYLLTDNNNVNLDDWGYAAVRLNDGHIVRFSKNCKVTKVNGIVVREE